MGTVLSSNLPQVVTLTDDAVLMVLDGEDLKKITVSQLGDIFIRADLADQPNGWPQLNASGHLDGPVFPQVDYSYALNLLTNEIGFESDTEVLRVGDLKYDLQHMRVADIRLLKPPGSVLMVTQIDSAPANFIKTWVSSGQYAVDWWDGTRTLVNSSVAATPPTISDNRPKYCIIYPATAGETITRFESRGTDIYHIDVSGCDSMTQLDCSYGKLRELIARNLSSLTIFDCHSNDLPVSIDLSGCAALTTVNVGSNTLERLDLTGCTALADLNLGYVASLQELDLSVFDLPSLASLSVIFSSVTSLILNGLTSLTKLKANNSQLTSIRAQGVTLSYRHPYHHHWSSTLASNQLDAAALNQFFTDLGVDAGATGVIDVSGNPGVLEAGYDPTIATAKGYTIID